VGLAEQVDEPVGADPVDAPVVAFEREDALVQVGVEVAVAVAVAVAVVDEVDHVPGSVHQLCL
jgi:hypothetical protein